MQKEQCSLDPGEVPVGQNLQGLLKVISLLPTLLKRGTCHKLGVVIDRLYSELFGNTKITKG